MQHTKRFFVLLILAVFSIQSLLVHKTSALDPAQRNIFAKGIRYYDLDNCSLEAESASGTDQNLDELVQTLADENQGTSAISVKTTDGSVVASANGSQEMDTRSTYKLYVAYAILRAVSAKKLSWGSVANDFNAMIEKSDNDAADRLRLKDEVGGPSGITKLLQDDVGLSNKTVMGTGSPSNPAGTNSKSTSDDFVKFLLLLDKQDLPGLSKSQDSNLYDKLLGAMKRQDARKQGLKSLEVEVADKPGWGPAPGAATNDVGIVYAKKKYVIAILTDYGNENWSYVAKVAKQINDAVEKNKPAASEESSGSGTSGTSGSQPKKNGSGSGSSGPKTTGNIELSGKTNAEKAYNYFTGKGLSGNAAAGIVGNLMQESAGGTEELNTKADNGSHFGIAQWDKVDRMQGLAELAKDTNRRVTDLDAQLDYIMHELGTGYKGTYEELKKADSPTAAAAIFLKGYERSGEGPGSQGYENRMKNAENLKKKYGEGSGQAPAKAQSNTCACGANDNTVVDASPKGKADGSIESFVNVYGGAAFAVGKRYGIPYEAILAQAGIESGWGKSDLTVDGNNFFGIKAGPEWKGKTLEFMTREDNPPRTIKAQFRAYDSPAAGFTGYASFIHHNSRYKEALKYPKDPEKYIEEIKKAGYATDNAYISKNVELQRKIKGYIKSKDLFPPSSEVEPEGKTPPKENEPSSGEEGETTASADCEPGSGASTGGGNVVKVAQEQYEKNKGINEFGGSILDYTDGAREAWCADFVSWVYKEAGTPFKDGTSGGWRHPGVVNLQAWFEKNHTYFKAGTKDPQPGDVAFYIGAQTPDGGSTEHVNIVISVNGDTMTTIGGNESNQLKKGERKIKLGDNSLAGFGRLK